MSMSASDRRVLLIAGSIVLGMAAMGVMIGLMARGSHSPPGSVTIRGSAINGPVTIIEAASLLRACANDADSVSSWISNRWNGWVSQYHPGSLDDRTAAMNKMLDDCSDQLEKLGINKRLADERTRVRDVLHAAQADESGPEVKEKLIKAYGIYGEMVGSALSPSGSFDNYHQQVARLSSDLTRSLSELSVMVGSPIKSAEIDPIVLPGDADSAPLR